MSYPYGPESYPTFEKLENKYALERLKNAYYFGVHRKLEERKKAFFDKRVEFNVDGFEDRNIYGGADFGIYPEEATTEDKGIAFVEALEYVFDEFDNDLDRFFQDIFTMLEDKVVSRADADENEWYRYYDYGRQLEALEEYSKTSETDYSSTIEQLTAQRSEFADKQREELEKKLSANSFDEYYHD